jgi:glycopeptide antibiotics resistance protein
MPSQLSRRLWLLFTVFIIYGATIPFRFTADTSAIAQKWSDVSLNPLIRSVGDRPSVTDEVQNILLFLPFGAMGMLARRGTSRFVLPRVVMVTGLAALLSVAVESAQLFTLDRVVSMNDVAANTLGGLLGALAALVAERRSIGSLPRLTSIGLVNVRPFYPLGVATMVLCAAAWQPFDVTIEGGPVVQKVRALQADLWQYGGVNDQGISLIHYVLFAAAAYAWLDALRVRHPAAGTVCLGVPMAFGLEASKILITSRMPGVEDAVVGAAGVVLGVGLCTLGPRLRAGAWLALLVAATAVAAAMEILSPFDIALEHSPWGLIPFNGYHIHTTFETLSHVIELWLLYAPLGFVFGLAVKTPARAMLAAVLASVIIAMPIEYGQGWIVGRSPDITDVAMSAVGAWLGAWAATRGAAMFHESLASSKRA